MNKQNAKNQGYSVILITMIISFIGMLMVYATQHYQRQLHAIADMGRRYDLETLKRSIEENLSCRLSIKNIKEQISSSLSSVCTGDSSIEGQSGPYFPLFMKTHDGRFKNLGTWIEKDDPADPRHMTNKLGDWYLRASCSMTDNSFIIRAAKINEQGQYIKDRTTKRILNFYGGSTAGATGEKWRQHLIAGKEREKCSVQQNGSPFVLAEAVVALNKDPRQPSYNSPVLKIISGSSEAFQTFIDKKYKVREIFSQVVGPDYQLPQCRNSTDVNCYRGYVSTFENDGLWRNSVRGLRCNTEDGWELLYCRSSQIDYADAAFLPGGCITNDFDSGAGNQGEQVELRIICLKQ